MPPSETSVAYLAPELRAALPLYTFLFDFIAGEREVKRRGTRYLPPSDIVNFSSRSRRRYELFVERALFYDIVGATVRSFKGQIFARDTAIKLPPKLKMLLDDADGSGTSFVQLARRFCGYLLPYGRACLLADYSDMSEDMPARPYIKAYAPWDILNWRSRRTMGGEKLELLVLRETKQVPLDEFQSVRKNKLKVLRLDDQGVYRVDIYMSDESIDDNLISTYAGDGSVMADTSPYYVANESLGDNEGVYGFSGGQDYNVPLYARSIFSSYGSDSTAVINSLAGTYTKVKTVTPMINGQTLDSIPVAFAGAENNDWRVDNCPLYGLAVAARDHYRFAAIYADTVVRNGQPTLVLKGTNRQWIEQNMPGGVVLGSHSAIVLPEGGDVSYVQASTSDAAMVAMKQQLDYCRALGAQLIDTKAGLQSATAFSLETNSSNSVLSSITRNASTALLNVLKIVAKFAGARESMIDFKLNTEFSLDRLSPQLRDVLIKEQNAKAITWSEHRESLRRAGIATLTDEEAEKEFEEKKEKSPAPPPPPPMQEPEQVDNGEDDTNLSDRREGFAPRS